VLLPEDLAAAFVRETGVELRLRRLLGRAMLIPEDDRLGSFGIIVGTLDDSVPLQFKTRTYGGDVLLVLWGSAEEKKLDAALRRILNGAA
jgi:hypothetical protein